jgi:hypothetical protein
MFAARTVFLWRTDNPVRQLLTGADADFLPCRALILRSPQPTTLAQLPEAVCQAATWGLGAFGEWAAMSRAV